MSKQVARNLKKARKLLIERGWCKHQYEDANGAHCALGAVRAVTGGFDDTPEAQALVRAVNGKGPTSVIDWNDRKSRRKAHVLEIYDKAINAELKAPSLHQYHNPLDK
jgi:hypothetical protein